MPVFPFQQTKAKNTDNILKSNYFYRMMGSAVVSTHMLHKVWRRSHMSHWIGKVWFSFNGSVADCFG